jgi:alpha-beta hydrolase superfamily lysophospholipase
MQNWKKYFRWIKIIFFIYTGIGLAFYFLQDAILFHPVELTGNHQYDFKQIHEDISIAQNETDTLNLLIFAAQGNQQKGVVLYFHGNKKNIGWYAKYIPEFTNNGYQVIMIDYPGFGKSKGAITEKKLYEWALQSYKIARKRFSADSIIIYGKSMGTGIATQLASVRDCKALVLETPYYDFPSVVSQYMPIYPIKWMLHYQIPTYQYIKNVIAPITIIHGTEDGVINYKQSLKLSKLLKANDQFITIKGGSHNDLFNHKQTIKTLDSVLTQ